MKEKEKNFGMTAVDYTPLGSIAMEGDGFRGMAEKRKAKSKWVRVFSIIFASIAFVVPGILAIFLLLFLTINDSGFNIQTILGTLFFLGFIFLYLGVGFKIISANLKK